MIKKTKIEIGWLITAIVAGIGNTFWGSFVFMKTWNWFVIDYFSIPQLTFVLAMGILLVIGFFKNIFIEPDKKEDGKMLLSKSITLFLTYSLTLLFGFIITLFL